MFVFVKEYAGSFRCAISTNCYGSSLAFLQELFAEAKKDFPHLQEADMEVVLYGGNTRRHIYGLEFTLSEDAVMPETYVKCEFLTPML